MEVPFTPWTSCGARGKLYGAREAVVDGNQRWSYEEFGLRCDRWSAALQRLGVKQGDRVAYIAPNTHAQLESFYAVPQIGAVLVPINFRLVADDFRYLIQHSGAKVVCAGADHLAAVDSIRADLTGVDHFVVARWRAASARSADDDSWLDYESLVKDASASFTRPTIGERDLLTINYTSGTTSRPKGVMITHRNAWMNCVGMLTHTPMTPADVYLWTLPMFHANGWTFTWTVTAAGAKHVCLPKFDGATVFKIAAQEKSHAPLRGADRAHHARERAGRGEGDCAEGRRRHDRGRAAGRRDDSADRGRARLVDHPDLRPHRNRAGDQHLRAQAGAPVAVEPRSARRSRRGRASS